MAGNEKLKGVDSTYVNKMLAQAQNMIGKDGSITSQKAAESIFNQYHIKISAEQIEKWSGYDGDKNLNIQELGAVLGALDGKRSSDKNFEFDGHIPDKTELGGDSADPLLSEYSNPERYELLEKFGAVNMDIILGRKTPDNSSKKTGVTNDIPSSNVPQTSNTPAPTQTATPTPTQTQTSENINSWFKKTEVKEEPFTGFDLSQSPYIDTNLAKPPYNKGKVLKMPDLPESYIQHMKIRGEQLVGYSGEISIAEARRMLVKEGNIDADAFETLIDKYKSDGSKINKDEMTGFLVLLDGQVDEKGKVTFDGHIPDKSEKEGKLANSLLNADGFAAKASRGLLLLKFGAYDAMQYEGIPMSFLLDARDYAKDPKRFSPSRG